MKATIEKLELGWPQAGVMWRVKFGKWTSEHYSLSGAFRQLADLLDKVAVESFEFRLAQEMKKKEEKDV